MPRSSLSAALAAGDLRAAQRALRATGAVDSLLTPVAVANASAVAAEKLGEARIRALEQGLVAGLVRGEVRREACAEIAEGLLGGGLWEGAFGESGEVDAEESVRVAVAAAEALGEMACVWGGEVEGLEEGLKEAMREVKRGMEEIRVLQEVLEETRGVTEFCTVEAVRCAIDAVDCVVAERRGGGAEGAKGDVLAARGEATTGKLRLLRAQTAADVYTKDSVRALEIVSMRTSERINAVQGELRVATRRLAEYRALGPEFEVVAQAFAAANSKMEQRVWSQRELGLGRKKDDGSSSVDE